MAGLVVLTVGAGYIAVDTGFTVTHYFQSNDPASLHSDWLFVLTIIWPAAAAFLYFMVQLVVVVRVLKESKPLSALTSVLAWKGFEQMSNLQTVLFSISAVLFILSQADYFALSNTICHGSHGKVDGSFIATLLETGAVGALFVAWRSITEVCRLSIPNLSGKTSLLSFSSPTGQLGRESSPDFFPPSLSFPSPNSPLNLSF